MFRARRLATHAAALVTFFVNVAVCTTTAPLQNALSLRPQLKDSKDRTRLSLRGGGVPVVPIAVLGLGVGVVLNKNEKLRGRLMKALSNIRIGRGGGRRKPKPQKRAHIVEPEKYDVRNGTWAHEVAEVQPGCLLLASPDTFRFAGPRQVLDQSVVLLVRHGPSGSSGFIINRPTQFSVGDVTKKLPMFESNPLYLGGDIGEGVYMIHGFPSLRNATEVSDGIYYGGSEHAMELVQQGKARPEDFRFFFKYAAWAPDQLEAEINSGCWCPVRTSLDLALKTKQYPGLHFAKAHKVFWHQVLQTLGGRFVNISRDTIVKEEAERVKMEEWVALLQDNNNQTVMKHEGIENGALAIATVPAELEQSTVDGVHAEVEAMSKEVQGKLKGGEEASVVLSSLSEVFFDKFSLELAPPSANDQPALQLVHNTQAQHSGSPLSLSFLYMATARQLGYPLRALNCTARMKEPVDFLMRHDAAGTAPVFVDLSERGAVKTAEQCMAALPAGSTDAALNPVPHVQLYSRMMHKLADGFARAGDEENVLMWLQQIRILQAAINTVAILQAGAQNLTETARREAAAAEERGPLQLQDLLGEKLLTADGEEVAVSDLKGKTVGVYFSAGWCQPCKVFTPQLIQTYSKLKIADGKPFEIVFVSADRSQEGFDNYYKQMPWLAVDYKDVERRSGLSSALQVQGIPKLALFDGDGKLMTSDGRPVIAGDPLGEKFPWKE